MEFLAVLGILCLLSINAGRIMTCLSKGNIGDKQQDETSR
jgi:hypothetical protein